MNVFGAMLALLLLTLYAGLPVVLGALSGAVVGGLVGRGRSSALVSGGICGSGLSLLAFAWVWCNF